MTNYDTWEETDRALELIRAMIDHVQTTYKKDKHSDEWEPYLKEIRKFATEIRNRRYALLNL